MSAVIAGTSSGVAGRIGRHEAPEVEIADVAGKNFRPGEAEIGLAHRRLFRIPPGFFLFRGSLR